MISNWMNNLESQAMNQNSSWTLYEEQMMSQVDEWELRCQIYLMLEE
jgi:hypothetical protein